LKLHGFPSVDVRRIFMVILKAKRNRKYWLLSKLERGILSLSLRYHQIQWPKLIRSITTIIDKLEFLMASRFKCRLQAAMPQIHERVARWNVFAKLVSKWLTDKKYLTYLTIMELNT